MFDILQPVTQPGKRCEERFKTISEPDQAYSRATRSLHRKYRFDFRADQI